MGLVAHSDPGLYIRVAFLPDQFHRTRAALGGRDPGVVKDSSGAAVPDSSITVTDIDTNEVRSTVTGNDGSFRIPALQPGHYTIRVEKNGFKTASETGLTLDVAQQLVVNLTLEVGATSSQQVVVTGEAAIVNTTTAALGGLVNDQSIADLPLNGRNFIDLSSCSSQVLREIPIRAPAEDK